MHRAIFVGLSTTLFVVSVHADDIAFERDIVPILEQRCWDCHSNDEPESGLRLDKRVSMLRGGNSGLAAVVPNHPEKSYLLDVVKHLDADNTMPPDEDRIPSHEIDLIERWIADGAIWPGQMDDVGQEEVDLWSFQPVTRPTVPVVGTPQSTKNPIDAFVLKELEQHNLTYSHSANPRVLLRRVSIVLTGLPPTLKENNVFLDAWKDNPESAYRDAVSGLLASPHFGERWAQHWLDVIRWAETNGSEANLYRKNAWVYRDYVIRSFNDDKPYDQFLCEQIAGDTMGVGEATGFLVAGPHVPAATVGREPSAIRQARADRMDEIIQTIGASVLGVTIGCARCHNHKFDPVTIRDYYAMTAVFQDIEFGSRQPEYSELHPLQQRGSQLWKQIASQRKALRQFGGWEENWGAYRELHFKPVTTKAIRIQFKMPNISLDELELFSTEDVNVAHTRNGTKLTGYPSQGVEDRNPIDRVNDGEFGTMVWRGKVEKDEERPWLQFELTQPETINRLRLSNNREYFYDTDYLEKKPGLPRYEFDIEILDDNDEWQPWVGSWYVNKKLPELHPERKALLGHLQGLINQLLEEGPRPSFVGRMIDPVVTRVLLRGSPENPRDEIFPAAPLLLNGDLGMTSESSGPQRRRAFANWITDPENPLTARVMVNRIWHHVFGNGLVSTTGDFGHAGASPSHKELLDWLAAEFVSPQTKGASAWSMKSLIGQMVLSKAFQQSSQPHEEGLRIDADSKLLWRFPPKRMEAEVIRDAILQAAGNLDLAVGGRSYRIHNEKKTYAQWKVIDNNGPQTWRRMIYQERMRRVDDQLFTAFDFPDCGQVRAKRPISTTPLQALNLMNSTFVIDQSRQIAQRATNDCKGNASKAITRCFELLLGRQPTTDERDACSKLIDHNDLSMVCRALINSNEFAFLP